MKISDLTPGQTVWDLHTYKVGNTTMRSWGTWPVKIISISPDSNFVEASWNHNAPRKYHVFEVTRWKKNEPLLIKIGFNQYRKATREEIKAHKLSKKTV